MSDLSLFLRRVAATGYQPGETDCALTVADWVRDLTGGPDPAAALRGSYASESGWRRIVAAAGGLMPLVGGLATAAGLVPVAPDAVRAGDIGVVRLRCGETCAIRTTKAWAVKVRAGIDIGPAEEMLAAWGLR